MPPDRSTFGRRAVTAAAAAFAAAAVVLIAVLVKAPWHEEACAIDLENGAPVPWGTWPVLGLSTLTSCFAIALSIRGRGTEPARWAALLSGATLFVVLVAGYLVFALYTCWE